MKIKEKATRDIRIRPSTHKKLQRIVRTRSLKEERLVTIPEIIEEIVGALYQKSFMVHQKSYRDSSPRRDPAGVSRQLY